MDSMAKPEASSVPFRRASTLRLLRWRHRNREI